MALSLNNLEFSIVEFHNSKITKKYPKITHLKPFEFINENVAIKLLTTSEEVVAEGEKMHHCVASYIPSIVRGDSKVYQKSISFSIQ